MSDNAKTGVGFMSIVMVALALCLTIFATQGFMTSRTNRQISEKRCEYLKQYYEADGEAVKLYEQIRAICLDVTASTIDKRMQLTGMENIKSVADNNGKLIICYNVGINDSMDLQVEIENDEINGTVNINKWSVISGEDEEEQGLKLWDGTI